MPGAHPSWDSCAQGHPISSCRVQALRLVCLQSACDNGWRSTTLVPCVHVLRVHIASWHHPAVGHRGWVWGLRCQMAQAQEPGLCCKAFPTWRMETEHHLTHGARVCSRTLCRGVLAPRTLAASTRLRSSPSPCEAELENHGGQRPRRRSNGGQTGRPLPPSTQL